MPTRHLPLLFLLACCTARTPPEAEPPAAAGDDPPGPLYTGPRVPSPPDPCVTGTVVQTLGWKVTLPVPCALYWVDKGDPPPDRAVEAPIPEELAPGGAPVQRGMPVIARPRW